MKHILLVLFVLLLSGLSSKNTGENTPTELKWHICEDSVDAIHKKLALPILKKFATETYYFDTAEKDLNKNKFVIRLKKENNKLTSELKMDYDDPRQMPDFVPPSMKCENNVYQEEMFLSCRVTYKKATQEKPISDTQETYLQEKLKKDISLIKLTSFGPYTGTYMKVKFAIADKKNIILTVEEVKGKSKTLTLSSVVNRVKAEPYAQEISQLLTSKNIQLCGSQKSLRPEY